MRRRQLSNFANNSQTGEQPFQPPACSVLPLLRFISLTHDLITASSLQSVTNEALQTEIHALSTVLEQRKNEVVEKHLQSLQHVSKVVGIEVATQANLFDVFSVMGKQRFPLLWREMIKIETIFATTVTCEQCFSVMKHTIQVNVKCDTLTAKVINKLHNGTHQKSVKNTLSERETLAEKPWDYFNVQTVTFSCLRRPRQPGLPRPQPLACQPEHPVRRHLPPRAKTAAMNDAACRPT